MKQIVSKVVSIAQALVIAISAFSSVFAMAATDGAIALSGTGSTGTVTVTLAKGDLVQITKLNDLVFGSLMAVPVSVAASDAICIFSTLGNYHISVASLNGSGAVTRMSDGAGGFMPYDLDINGTPLAHLSNTAMTGANTSDSTCGGGTNATLTATVTNAYFAMGPAGFYNDVLTLLVTAP